jgi:hypothetical protein
VTGVSEESNIATVLRGQSGTNAATHSDGTIVTSILPIYDVAGERAATEYFGLGGAWDQATGTLTLSLIPGAMLANDTQYAVSFRLKNPVAAQFATSPDHRPCARVTLHWSRPRRSGTSES